MIPQQETQKALIDRVFEVRSIPERILEAPCVFCGYRGGGYWQGNTHVNGCPWFGVGGVEERRAKLRDTIEALSSSSGSEEKPPSSGDLGLALDMLDSDRLRNWADNLDTYGTDISHWADRRILIERLRDLAGRIEATVREVGTLRELTGSASAETQVERADAEWRDVIRCHRWCACHHDWQHRPDRPPFNTFEDVTQRRHCTRCKCAQARVNEAQSSPSQSEEAPHPLVNCDDCLRDVPFTDRNGRCPDCAAEWLKRDREIRGLSAETPEERKNPPHALVGECQLCGAPLPHPIEACGERLAKGASNG